MTNPNMPLLRFEGFEGEWAISQLGDMAHKVTEKNNGLVYSETFTNSAERGVVSQMSYFDHKISNDDNIDGYYVVRPDDFVYNPRISSTAPVGPINRNKLGRTGVVSPLYTVFRIAGVDFQFLDSFFKSSTWHSFLKENGDRGARGDRLSISQNVFFELPMSIPSVEEQQAIGRFFAKLNNLIDAEAQLIMKLKQTRNALLQRMYV